MTVKQWYRHLLETNVTMEKLDNEGRMKVKLCKVEEREPDVNWQVIYHMSRLKGHNPQVKSFNFKLVHQLLPCKERLSQILPSSAPLYSLCTSQQPESIFHSFFECDRNKDAALYLLNLTRVYDSTVSALKITRLQISTEVLCELQLCCFSVLAWSLFGDNVWKRRQQLCMISEQSWNVLCAHYGNQD